MGHRLLLPKIGDYVTTQPAERLSALTDALTQFRDRIRAATEACMAATAAAAIQCRVESIRRDKGSSRTSWGEIFKPNDAVADGLIVQNIINAHEGVIKTENFPYVEFHSNANGVMDGGRLEATLNGLIATPGDPEIQKDALLSLFDYKRNINSETVIYRLVEDFVRDNRSLLEDAYKALGGNPNADLGRKRAEGKRGRG